MAKAHPDQMSLPARPSPKRPSPRRRTSATPPYWEFAVAALFFLSRLPNLASVGLGYDEATYLHWGQRIAADWDARYFPATAGGKQPLHALLVGLSERVFADPILAGRLVSVAAGALTLIAIYLTGRRLFSRRVAIIASLLYVLCPFTLLFDRTAMIDSLLAAEAMWLLYLGIRLADRREPLAAAALAVCYAAALLTKTIGAYFPLLLPLSLLAGRSGWPDRRQAARSLALMLVGLAVGYGIYYVLYGIDPRSAWVSRFEDQYGRYTMRLEDILRFPWSQWSANSGFVLRTSSDLLTIPLALAGLISLVTARWLGRSTWLLAGWVVLPIAAQVLIAARFFDRYILFSVPPLLILTGRLLECIYQYFSRRWPGLEPVFSGRPATVAPAVIVLAAMLLPAAAQDVGVMSRVGGSYSGLAAMRRFIADGVRSRPAADPVYVIVDATPSPVEDGTSALLHDVSGVKVLRIARFTSDQPLSVFDEYTMEIYPREYLAGQEAYYIHAQAAETNSRLAGRLRLVRRFPNSTLLNDYIGLYQVYFDDSIE